MDKENVVCIHNGILLNHQKNEILPFATTWMELEGVMLSKISQSEKDNYHMISPMWNLRNKTEDHRGREEKQNKIKLKRATNYETLNHRKETEGCWKGGGGEMG